MQSRLAVLISGANWAWWRVCLIFRPQAPRPTPFNWNYSGKSVFGIGIIHGLGAETPSQLMLFLLAASLGGTAKGFMGLAAFAIGLIVMNTLMTASLGGIFGAGNSRPHLYHWVAWAGAVYSVAVGVCLSWWGLRRGCLLLARRLREALAQLRSGQRFAVAAKKRSAKGRLAKKRLARVFDASQRK